MKRRDFLKTLGLSGLGLGLSNYLPAQIEEVNDGDDLPNIVLTMTDDQGWGETAYNGHPLLKTPNLDAMAANGLRLDRFYAAAPVCSPTRASFLTGRHPFRYGTTSQGRPLRIEEHTLAQLAKRNGYRTAFFGKWHLNGISGRGKPVSADDPLNPGAFGFDHWVAATNYYDLEDKLGTEEGKVVENQGDTSTFLAEQALKFISAQTQAGERFLVIIWYPSPHGRYDPVEKYQKPYPADKKHLGEIAGVDAAVGMLRKGLREDDIADNTMFFFCSDNGAPGKGGREVNGQGPLRGHKGNLWEGGVRVPGLFEWPKRIEAGRVSSMVTSTSDLYPTLAALFKNKDPEKPEPIDGVNLLPLLDGNQENREKPLGFKDRGGWSWIDGDWKLQQVPKYAPEIYKPGQIILVNLAKDVTESKDLSTQEPERVARMKTEYEKWEQSVNQSASGGDYQK